MTLFSWLSSAGRIRTCNLMLTLIPVFPRSVDYIITLNKILGVPVSSLYGSPESIKGFPRYYPFWVLPLSRNFHFDVSIKGCNNLQASALPLRHRGMCRKATFTLYKIFNILSTFSRLYVPSFSLGLWLQFDGFFLWLLQIPCQLLLRYE